MTTTTGITSTTVEVADQDRALAFYRDVLGCEVRVDAELWPGGRWLEVAPPGSDVGIALLTRASGFPIGVRYGTRDADAAHAALREAGVEPDQDVLRLDFAPPMFTLQDLDGNTVVLIEDAPPAPGAEDRVAVVRALFAAYLAQDRAAAERLVGDDLVFTSPQDDRIDRAAYFERCFPTASRVRHQELCEVAPTGGDGVFVMYEYELVSGGRHRNSELITVRDGQVHEVQVFFGGSVG